MNKQFRIPVNPDGAATLDGVKPCGLMSRAENNDGQKGTDAQRLGAVDADPAEARLQPIWAMQDQPPFAGDGDTDRATSKALPSRYLPDQPNSDAGESRPRSGQPIVGAHTSDAGSDQYSGGQCRGDAQSGIAAAGDDAGLSRADAHDAGAPVIAEIVQLWRMRQRWHRAEKSLVLQGKAICRAFLAVDDLHSENEKVRLKAQNAVKSAANKMFDDARDGKDVDPVIAAAVAPFVMSIEQTFEPQRAALEKRLKALARKLPVWTGWAKDVRGFGELSLAAIVGEAGDLSGYSNPAKLWKRMGLAVVNGERQRKKSDAAEAAAHGYRPARRSVVWNIGGGLIGAMGHGPRPCVGEDVSQREDLSPYQKLFVRFIREEVAKVSETWNGPDHSRDPVERKGELFESYSAHAAARAKRRVEKEFLVHLLMAWRAAGRDERETQLFGVGSPTISGSDAGASGQTNDDPHAVLAGGDQ